MDCLSTNKPTCPSFGWVRYLSRSSFLPIISFHRIHPSAGRRLAHELSMPPSFGAAWDNLDIEFWSFLKDPLMVHGDNFQEFSNPNTIFYEFNTSHIIFILNEHIKLNETSLGTQGHFKVHLSNIMDVLGCLTSKLHETQKTDYTCYKNSFIDL